VKPFIRLYVVKPADARGWIGLGSYILVLLVLGLMWSDKSLLRDDFFKVIATAIILTGWNQGPVGWAYQATKGGGELADKNADIVKARSAMDAGAPMPVKVENASDDPVPVESTQ
jgi:hypothetical protein